MFSFAGELPRTGIPNHLNSNLLNGNATDTSERRSPGNYPPPTSKPQIRVVTPPLKYSPKTIQQLQPINQTTANSLPYPSLAQLNASNSHHKPIGSQADHVPQASLHHYSVPTSQTQSPYTSSQQPLPLTHHQFSTSSPHYPPVSDEANERENLKILVILRNLQHVCFSLLLCFCVRVRVRVRTDLMRWFLNLECVVVIRYTLFTSDNAFDIIDSLL